MIYSGVDLVEIKRIEKSLENPKFLEKYFGDDEKEELKKKKYKSQSVAACFAAKEAFSKVVKTGLSGFNLCEVQLLHEESGAPYLCLFGKAKELAKGLEFSVSISHTDELAMALVVATDK